MPYSKVYNLKQHTPIIHFQYTEAEEGATLRASEVKPKLDRYLLECLRNESREVPSDWLLSQTSDDKNCGVHLNYKMRFSCTGSETFKLGRYRDESGTIHTEYDIYWANMGEATTPVEGLLGHGIKMTILCMIPDLMTYITHHADDFFMCHNFGRMQSKGFGSYTIDRSQPIKQQRIADVLCAHFKTDTCYTFDGGASPFGRIKTIWSVMKSGYNFRGMYRRSLLFMYMHEHSIGNEKAWMKQNGFASRPSQSPLCTNPDTKEKYNAWQTAVMQHEAHYVRALLGAGDHVDFLIQQGVRNHIFRVQINDQEKDFRCQSPVMFKIIDNHVYYIGKEIHEKMWGRSFKFTGKEVCGRDINSRNDITPESLSIPKKEDIGEHFISSFLAYCYDNFEYPPNGQKKLSDIEPGLRVHKLNPTGGASHG